MFLHGKGDRAPEVQVLWRADLDPVESRDWLEAIALCPPVTGEMLSASLHRLRAFLARSPAPDESDIEGAFTPESDSGSDFRPCIVWRGREQSRVASTPTEIRSNDVVVLPAAYGMRGLGQTAGKWLGEAGLDVWEPALLEAGRPAVVRLHRAVLEPWRACKPVTALLELICAPELDHDALDEAIGAVLEYAREPDSPSAEGPPELWRKVLAQARRFASSLVRAISSFSIRFGN
jgi:hypothetical protein